MPQFQKFLAVPRYARGKLWFAFSAARIIAAASFRGCTKSDHDFDNFPRGVEGNGLCTVITGTGFASSSADALVRGLGV